MRGRQVLLYFAWSRPGEIGAPLTEIDDRFPALFELRRLFYPAYEVLADPAQVDQGVAGFLNHVQKPNFLPSPSRPGRKAASRPWWWSVWPTTAL